MCDDEPRSPARRHGDDDAYSGELVVKTSACAFLGGIVCTIMMNLVFFHSPGPIHVSGPIRNGADCSARCLCANGLGGKLTKAHYDNYFKLGRKMLGYELPLPEWSAPVIHRHWFNNLPTLFDLRIDAQKQLWQTFIDQQYVTSADSAFLKDRGMYPDLDRTFLWCILRHLKPRRMLEIGAGQSTVVAQAAMANLSVPCEHTVIEPFRYSEVPSGVNVLKHELQVRLFLCSPFLHTSPPSCHHLLLASSSRRHPHALLASSPSPRLLISSSCPHHLLLTPS